jgi:hypothetical protein
VALVPLRRHGAVVAFAIVDEPDLEMLLRYSWRLRHDGYPVRTVRRTERKTQGTSQMGREVLGLEVSDPREVDHINRNKLDNRRENLRLATTALNAQNRTGAGGSSRYRGVTWHRGCQKWQSATKLNGKTHYHGLFELEEDAAEAARLFRLRYMPFAGVDLLSPGLVAQSEAV